jgi:zinc/manganese transport system substrate-binding protein
MRMRTILAITLGTAVLTACGGSHANTASGALDVVASTNAYGDVVSQIGGTHVSVTSVLSNPNADPHLFEPGTRNGLAVAKAGLVVQNGAGYDAFMEKLESAAPSSDRVVVTIADALGVHGRDANPHLWYDVPRLGRIGAAIAAGLERADPAHAPAYRAGLARFRSSLHPLDREVTRIRTRFAGTPVAYTEPVPGYLLAAAGLRNLAPDPFTRAIENGTEPAPQAVADMFGLVEKRRVRILLYNSQAVSPLTARLRDAAESAGVGVVPVTETLPSGRSFQQWQLEQARALEAALSG